MFLLTFLQETPMKKRLLLLLFAYIALSTAAWSKSMLIMDPVTHRPVIVNEDDLPKQNVPFLTEQPPQTTPLAQATTPPPPPELAQMPQLSFSQATRTPGQVLMQGSQSTGPELRGCIRIDNYDEKIPEFRICFNGKETISNGEGFYSIPLGDEEFSTFSLVICRTFTQQFDKTNTIKSVALIPDKDYKCYTFTKRGGSDSWTDQATNIDSKNFVIPPNSVIVLIPPKYIERLEAWETKLPSNYIKLPAIVLKKDVAGKSLERISAKSLLYSLDKTVFHEPIKELRKVDQSNPKVCMSLAQ